MDSTPYNYDLGNCWIEKNDIAQKKRYINDNTIIVLVDDFIGTGETALGAIDYLHEILGTAFPHERIKVMSIVSQQVGRNNLNAIGVDVYANYVLGKGISDYYTNQELTDAKELMKKIENKLDNLHNEFRFGYKQSEALVCMKRCPNNTFPVYWLGKKTAPYER